MSTTSCCWRYQLACMFSISQACILSSSCWVWRTLYLRVLSRMSALLSSSQLQHVDYREELVSVAVSEGRKAGISKIISMSLISLLCWPPIQHDSRASVCAHTHTPLLHNPFTLDLPLPCQLPPALISVYTQERRPDISLLQKIISFGTSNGCLHLALTALNTRK